LVEKGILEDVFAEIEPHNPYSVLKDLKPRNGHWDRYNIAPI